MHLNEKFIELEELLLKRRETIGTHTGVPFILLIYSPEEKKNCQKQFKNLCNKLKDKEVPFENITLSTFIFKAIEQVVSLDEVFNIEKEDPDSLNRELSGIIKEQLINLILDISKNTPDKIIFLTQVSALYPFVRVSNLLTDLENKIKNPFIVFYPGTQEEENLYFLNIRNYSDSSYYRAMKI